MADNEDVMTENELLRQMFLKYWQWNVDPVLDNPPANSPEYFVKSMYKNLKADALSKYPWRSATVYVNLEPAIPEQPADERYKYEVKIPDNFVIATGFWEDKERLRPRHNSVDIVGRMARTNLKKFTMGYINKDVDEAILDPWVCDFIAIYIAAELADLGGQAPDRKTFLLQQVDTMLVKCGNRDYEMAHRDEVSNTIHQFEYEAWC